METVYFKVGFLNDPLCGPKFLSDGSKDDRQITLLPHVSAINHTYFKLIIIKIAIT